MSEICKICFQEHRLQYLDAVNGATHLIYRCPNTKSNRTVFLSFIPDLPIPHTMRKKDLKTIKENIKGKWLEENQLKLF